MEKVNQSGAVIFVGMQRDAKDTVPELEETAATAPCITLKRQGSVLRWVGA